MRKRFLLISTILVLSAFTFAACGKKSPSSPEASSETTTEEVATEETTTEDNTADTTAEEEKPVSTATEATKDSTEEVTTASKKDEQAKPKTATGTYNGFADTNSVEIELSNGTFETFIVNDDDVKTALSKKSEGDKITFTYGAVEGQANKEILSVK
jgi:predicted small lipoprotein YifL